MWWARIFSTPLLGDDHGVRLRVHIEQRWLAVVGQLIAILITDSVLQFSLPIAELLLLVLASVFVNLWLLLRYPISHILTDRQAIIFFSYDLIQLTALLYLTGGLANPFAVMILAPIAMASTVLRARSVFFLGVIGQLLIAFLRFSEAPIVVPGLVMPDLYLTGVWVGLMLSIVFMPGFIWRVSHERRRMSRALAATEKVLEREVRLSALDGLAAAAAHQLGTPLGTITLISKELLQKENLEETVRNDLELLYQQSLRCRQILSHLTDETTQSDVLISRLTLRDMLNEAIQEVDIGAKEIVLDVSGTLDEEPVLPRRPEIIYGVGNLIENATDFAQTKVNISAFYSETDIVVTIEDDGPGFPPEILQRLGEPYTTERQTKTGMGLGFFIAKTLLERSGAEVTVSNLPASDQDRARKFMGAKVRLRWPRGGIKTNDELDIALEI